MGRFHIDTPTAHYEVDTHEAAWVLIQSLWKEGYGEPVECNDTRYTKKAEWDAAVKKAQNKQLEAARVAKKGTKRGH
jgi:hypothetical protein